MKPFVWETPDELDKKLAERVRNIRKRRSLSQQQLAEQSGVSYGSISLLGLTRIAVALDIADELRELFTRVPYKDIQEVMNETNRR